MKIHYLLPNELEELGKLMQWVESLDGYKNLTSGTRYALELALEEMTSNIIKYGFDDTEEHDIDIYLDFLQNGDVRVTLKDDGHPFDPLTEAIKSELNGDVRDMDIGGMGIYLVKSMSRDMSYRWENEINILEFTIAKK